MQFHCNLKPCPHLYDPFVATSVKALQHPQLNHAITLRLLRSHCNLRCIMILQHHDILQLSQLSCNSATHCNFLTSQCSATLQGSATFATVATLSPDMPIVFCFICDLILNICDMHSLSHWFQYLGLFLDTSYTLFRCIHSPRHF
jgi:hypothetical protein